MVELPQADEVSICRLCRVRNDGSLTDGFVVVAVAAPHSAGGYRGGGGGGYGGGGRGESEASMSQ